VLGRTGSEGVRGMFREQSWKCCLWVTVNRCKPNFRGLGVYVPRSVDWHPALWCIISLLTRTNDGNQVAPLTREHPRRRYTPVDYPRYNSQHRGYHWARERRCAFERCPPPPPGRSPTPTRHPPRGPAAGVACVSASGGCMGGWRRDDLRVRDHRPSSTLNTPRQTRRSHPLSLRYTEDCVTRLHECTLAPSSTLHAYIPRTGTACERL